MPTYQYECLVCFHTFDIEQSIKDKPLEICEECGGSLQKIIGCTSFILSGSGWFRDGYAKAAN